MPDCLWAFICQVIKDSKKKIKKTLLILINPLQQLVPGTHTQTKILKNVFEVFMSNVMEEGPFIWLLKYNTY